MYDWNYRETTREKWLQFEASVYKQAGQYIKNSKEQVSIMDNSEKGFHPLPVDWTAYYNPIEKE